MFDDYCYDIMTIGEYCFDVYVSDDGGYTWEYYGSYENYEQARDDGEAAVLAAKDRGDYISHGK